ncbi:MAG: ATP-binding protein, partial [Bacteroidales bacterium]|nr:ATP-binding protein [Bacteroidales bacterium]
MTNEPIDEQDIFNQPEETPAVASRYGEDQIIHLEDMEHIRLRPGMYIGKLGDGASQDDGIYVLIKEVMDNSIDEFTSGFGKKIELRIDPNEKKVSIRDYGRGIPLGKLVEAVSQLNTGAKYDSKVFQKSVGLNGVGTKAVNALSSYFKVQSIREGKTRIVEFSQGKKTSDTGIVPYEQGDESGTLVEFIPDSAKFGNFH